MRRSVFTPGAVELIRESARQGKSAVEIADVIGSTAASVRVKCCQLKIKLSRRGGASAQHDWRRYVGEGRLTVFMQRADYTALERKAAHKHKSAFEFARMLLHEIISSNIYENVLDDVA